MFSAMDLGQGTPQDDALAEALAAVASSARIMLLRQMRTPKALREIELRTVGSRDPAPLRESGEPRTLSRQAVKTHLDRLVEIGVVSARETERDYGPTVEYVVNHQRLFAIAEEVRELAKIRPTAEPQEPTLHGGQAASNFDLKGPCLVLVKGLDEGRTFDLPSPAAGRGEWVIGRRRGLHVALDFDPFVSTENSSIVYDAGSYFLQDLPDNRNGTLLNFRRLPSGGRHALGTGDLIGVGRSLMMFRR
jgi:FHA domain-containing protein